jgi:2-polyprenyl-3-methyl-5-hydroxy-6-metoxy-1,4-benzoquinol methylase
MSNRDKTRANSFDRRAGLLQTLKVIEVGVGKSILDLGCGIGQFTPMFLDKFERVVGLDPSIESLREARIASARVEYIEGWGESFTLNEKFDTISMDNLLEHVDDPIAVLKNCKKHLANAGRIVAQVPNAESITRRLGVLMGLIDSLGNISEQERTFFGHQRTYTLAQLEADAKKAGLRVLESGGILYKPLPNDTLEKICVENGEQWAKKFIDALLEFGKDRPRECAYVYVVCD